MGPTDWQQDACVLVQFAESAAQHRFWNRLGWLVNRRPMAAADPTRAMNNEQIGQRIYPAEPVATVEQQHMSSCAQRVRRRRPRSSH